MITANQRHIAILAGEKSGDVHAAKLAEELKRLDPSLRFWGIGGDAMRQVGVELITDTTHHVPIGLMGVPRAIREQYGLMMHVVWRVQHERPAAVILVDYPEFNLRVAARVRGLGVPVIYFICPQLWAWRSHRIERIKKSVDKLYVLFDFEKALYDKHGADCEWMGHPLIDAIESAPRADLRAELGIAPERLLVGILPGSRRSEFRLIAPRLLEAARIARKELGDFATVMSRAPAITDEMVARVDTSGVSIVPGRTADILRAADVALVASGTTTLEAAALIKPMIVAYTTSPFTYYPLIHLLEIPDYALPNIVAGRRIVPEFIQRAAKPEAIARELAALARDEGRREAMKEELRKVRAKLGPPGAINRAATSMLKFLA
jgi:lipid-A-disaccharide synthase